MTNALVLNVSEDCQTSRISTIYAHTHKSRCLAIPVLEAPVFKGAMVAKSYPTSLGQMWLSTH